MIDKYLNETATWRTVTSVNQYNEPTYTDKSIKCRSEGTNRLVNNSLGQAVTVGTRVFTKEQIKVNDMIDDRQVVTVEVKKWRDGSVSHYEVYLV